MAENKVQKAVFTRTATKDLVTQKITYTDFQPNEITLPAIPKKDFPVIAGFHLADGTHDVPSIVVNPNSTATQTITIHYVKDEKMITLKSSSNLYKWYNYDNQEKNIIKTYELGYGEGDSSKAGNKWIIAHSTATPNATARQEAQYFKNNWSSSETYTQLVVDDKDAYLIGDFGWVAWGAGYTGNHGSPVQIELCEFPNDKTRALKAYYNFISLLRQYAKYYNIPIKVDENYPSKGIDTHSYLAQNNHETTHTDPYTYLQSIGISKAQFKRDVEGGTLKALDGSGSASQPATPDKPSKDFSKDYTKSGSTKYWKIGSNGLPVDFTPTSVRFTASTRRYIYLYAPFRTNPHHVNLEKGMSVIINATLDDGHYLWGHYLNYSGNHSYVIMENTQSKEKFGRW